MQRSADADGSLPFAEIESTYETFIDKEGKWKGCDGQRITRVTRRCMAAEHLQMIACARSPPD